MLPTQFTKIGTILKTYGFEGELIIISEYALKKHFSKNKWLFIEIDSEKIPFRISKCHISPTNIIVKFKDLDYERASKLKKCNVYTDSQSVKIIKTTNDFRSIRGYKIYDTKTNYLGILTDIIKNKSQLIFVVFSNNREILIPAVSEFITAFDSNNKTITLELPEGLIDIYLNGKP